MKPFKNVPFLPLVLAVALAVFGSLLLVSCQAEGGDSQNSADRSSTAKTETEDPIAVEDSVLSVVPGADALVSDMEAGRIPESANVLYDEMGGRPDVDVSDPQLVSEIYDGLSKVKVESPNGMGCTDCYHHVWFRLQDGTEVYFGFEGAETLVVGREYYEVSGGEDLWSLVRSLQAEEMDASEE